VLQEELKSPLTITTKFLDLFSPEFVPVMTYVLAFQVLRDMYTQIIQP
jgi:hypothetical protein